MKLMMWPTRGSIEKKSISLTCLVLLLVPLANSARALNIQLIDTTGMTVAQTAAFDEAAQLWESRLDDPIVVVLNVGFGNLGSNVLGSTSTALAIHAYTNLLRTAMIADAGSVPEQNAFSALPVVNSPVPPLRVEDHAGQRTVTQLLIATANAKALGLSPGNPVNPQANSADGTVIFANAFDTSFDYDRSDGIASGKTDFVAVAAHEIGHALGFVSATDIADDPQNSSIMVPPTPLDIWRFTDTGGAHVIGSPGPEARLITAGPAEYYDSNVNNLDLSHGMYAPVADPACPLGGGICQASHWSDDVGSLMDPSIAPGVLQNPTFNDSHAFDFIGYDHTPKFIFSAASLQFLIKWITQNLPDPPASLPGFPEPTPPTMITPPFDPDGAGVVAFEFPGHRRSATAFYRFAESAPYAGPHFAGFTEDDVGDGQVILFPDEPAPETSPDSFMEFYMESDAEGTFFTAVGALSVNGTGFDSEIGGGVGGYRFDVVFYGEGDGISDDIDAFGTFFIEADASGQPDPIGENVFQTGTSDPNRLVMVDLQGLPEPLVAGALGIGAAMLVALGRRREGEGAARD
jgi:hypothetical protein